MKILFRIKNAFSMLGINKKYPEKKEPNVRNMVAILSRGCVSLARGNIATEKTIKKLRDKILNTKFI